MAIALVIALLLSGGASVAADRALPGDVLYPFKVNVNEEVSGWFALSDEARAELDAWRAERRLAEAEELVVKGKITAEARADLEARFDAHADRFLERVGSWEADGRAEASSGFEASLRAHESILARLAEIKTGLRSEVDPLLARTRVKLNAVATARAEAETVASGGAQGTVEAGADTSGAAEGKLGAAENKIAEVRNFIAKMEGRVAASVTADAEARLDLADAAVADGKARLAADAYHDAVVKFDQAMRIAQSTKLIASTAERLSIDLGVNVRGQADARTGTSTQATSSADLEARNGGTIEIRGNGNLRLQLGE